MIERGYGKSEPDQKALGRIQFILMDGSEKLQQRIDLPRFAINEQVGGREVFAKWTPDYESISEDYLTDVNGFSLIKRKVFQKETPDYFASSFYPIDASITIKDSSDKRSMTIWNDRP